MTPAMPENESPWRKQSTRHDARRRAAFVEDVLENWKYHMLPWEIEMVLEEPEDDEWWAAAVFPGGVGGDGECVRACACAPACVLAAVRSLLSAVCV
jgi:hypothetical protein